MNDRRSSSDLGSSAEAALSAFPFPERDWESDARAVEARLGDSVRGSTDASLLAAPLPSEPDEPSSVSATATPLTNSGVRTQTLTELARRSVEKEQANVRQMARESLAIAAQQRQRPAPSDPPAAPASVNPIAPVGVPRVSGLVVKSDPWAKVALALPILGLAAAALFWLRRPEPAPLLTNPIAPAAASAPHAPTAVAENRPPLAQDTPHGVDPNSLPGEVTAATDPLPAKGATASSAALAGTTPAKGAPSKITPKGTQAAPAEPTDKSLPPDPELRPADSRGGELPAKPSTGAVQAALGSVLSGARHCVAGDDAPSSAVVVFGSDGRVQHVTVSGSAAGKSAATCIEAQLSRARVQPFASSNFSVNATVRPE
ncbi:MAG: hypothetical protein WDO69_19110 [Pseudomonadota bacterium]